MQWLKTGGTTAVVLLFFVGYFALLRRPDIAARATVMPLTVVDAWVPFEPRAIWVYLSLWIYVGVAPACLPDLRRLLRYGVWAVALCTAGLACFWAWPTEVPATVRAGAGAGHAAEAAFALMRGVDSPGNACPSMHVAAATFSAIWIRSVLAEVRAPRSLHMLNLAWWLAIGWSTLAVRQHVWLDVLAGAALGAAFGALSRRVEARADASRGGPALG